MSHTDLRSAERPPFDEIIQRITDYVLDQEIDSQEAFTTARHCLMDSLGCGLLALSYPACTKLLGPVVPGAELSEQSGTRVPGLSYRLDPVQAAFNIGTMIRWLDFNDTWLAAEWGHPSDNLGGILASADYLSRQRRLKGGAPLQIQEVLDAMIRAHEIQGVLALDNSFNRVGLDHVLLVRIASTAVVARLFGGSRSEIASAVSHAFVDGSALRTYRHAPNTGSRKSWAAGDATARAVRLALLAMSGEMGYPSALTAKTWGFQDVSFGGESLSLQRDFGSYVMENVLFKLSFPAEFHAQTAVEAAITLHASCGHRLDDIERVEIETQESGVRIIDKTGRLDNPADRDHCIQYMVAVGLIKGGLTADDYEDAAAANPAIDALREKMTVRENPDFTRDYLDPDKRAIGNAVQVHFSAGSSTERVAVDYPIGHRRRRAEGIPVLEEKFRRNVAGCLSAKATGRLIELCSDEARLMTTPVDDFMDLLAR